MQWWLHLHPFITVYTAAAAAASADAAAGSAAAVPATASASAPHGTGTGTGNGNGSNSGLAFDAFFAVAAGDVGTAAAFLEAGGDPNLRTLAPLR